MYTKVVRLARSLWQFGYMHGDLHLNNIIVDAETQEPVLIDLGLSMELDSNIRVPGQNTIENNVFLRYTVKPGLNMRNYQRALADQGHRYTHANTDRIYDMGKRIGQTFRQNTQAQAQNKLRSTSRSPSPFNNSVPRSSISPVFGSTRSAQGNTRSQARKVRNSWNNSDDQV